MSETKLFPIPDLHSHFAESATLKSLVRVCTLNVLTEIESRLPNSLCQFMLTTVIELLIFPHVHGIRLYPKF